MVGDKDSTDITPAVNMNILENFTFLTLGSPLEEVVREKTHNHQENKAKRKVTGVTPVFPMHC